MESINLIDLYLCLVNLLPYQVQFIKYNKNICLIKNDMLYIYHRQNISKYELIKMILCIFVELTLNKNKKKNKINFNKCLNYLFNFYNINKVKVNFNLEEENFLTLIKTKIFNQHLINNW